MSYDRSKDIYLLSRLSAIFFATMAVLLAPAYSVTITTSLEQMKDSHKKDSGLSGNFGYYSNELVQDVGVIPGNRNFGFFDVKYKSHRSGGIDKTLDIVSKVNDQQILEYSVKEALLERKYSTSRIAIGRGKLAWSSVDQVWGLGKVNNRVNFDYFEPGQEGLVGLFYDKKIGAGFDVSLFGSTVYVPELSQGMIIDKKKGTVVCKTAWCDAPSVSAPINGKNVPIFYNVEYPETSDVVFKTSAGIKLGYTYEKFHMNGFYIRKPENQVSIVAEVSIQPDFRQVNANVTPQFFYHDVKGGNLELKITDNLKIYGSGISIIPNKYPTGDNPYIQYTGIKPKKKREDYLSGGALYSSGSLNAHVGYIARVSEFDTESDLLVNYPRWNQAVSLSLSKNISRKMFIGLDYKFDMITDDRLTMVKTSYRFGPSVVATFGMNIIGTNPSKESFWSKYENNDSVYSSFKYTF